MAEDSDPQPDPELIRGYELYDRCVDVVSAFHWLFTDTSDMPKSVLHFERYPRIPVKVDGEMRTLTPDFTVVFTDGTGIVAEIANIALHENSVDKLCRQLLNYSTLKELPGPNRAPVPVSGVDVVFLSPLQTAADAAERVFVDRVEREDHWYKPAQRPILMQFAQQPDEYVFQPWPDRAQNGKFREHGPSDIEKMDFRQLVIKPSHFAQNKIRYAFCNDPIPPLYLATRIIVSVFPTLQPVWGDAFETTTAEIANALQRQYGHGLTSDVTKAMELLRSAGLVTFSEDSWRVLRSSLRLNRESVHTTLATRLAGRTRLKKSKRVPGATPLFDDPAELDRLVAASEESGS